MKTCIEFSDDPLNFFVKYNSPTRKISDFRTECYNDAVELRKNHSDFIILFSTGIDSQIITRSFLDANVNAKYVFLHAEKYNDKEYHRLFECEKFYGIDIEVIKINLDEFKDKWLQKSLYEKPSRMFNYPFELLSKLLHGTIPIVFQGPSEPAIVASGTKTSIYHNYFDGMLSRQRSMQQYRKVIDFPFSPESITSYYTDDAFKGFCHSLKYISNSGITKDLKQLNRVDYFEYFCKPILKGKHFKNDIIWYEKNTGFESFPKWFKPHYHVKETRVSVPYWDLVDFLESAMNQSRMYKDWFLPQDIQGFISINT